MVNSRKYLKQIESIKLTDISGEIKAELEVVKKKIKLFKADFNSHLMDIEHHFYKLGKALSNNTESSNNNKY